MTAAVNEAEFVPRVRNEVSKTKLHFNLSPAAGINLVLGAGRFVDRDLIISPGHKSKFELVKSLGQLWNSRSDETVQR